MSDETAVILLVGRILFVLLFLGSSMFHFLGSEQAIGYARNQGMPFPQLAGAPTGVFFLVVSAMIVLGIWPDIAFLALTAFLLVAALYYHRFWDVEGEARQSEQTNFLRNISIAGACLALFALWANFGEVIDLTITDQLIDLS